MRNRRGSARRCWCGRSPGRSGHSPTRPPAWHLRRALSGEWASIRTGTASFRDDVSRAADATDVVHVTTALQLARQDWKAVIGQAQQLTARLVDIAPKDIENVLNMAA
jgi:hypothetical protein